MDNKILSIQNINFETLGTLEKLIKLDGYQVENIQAQKDLPSNVEQYAAIIVLGGPMAVYDNLAYLK